MRTQEELLRRAGAAAYAALLARFRDMDLAEDARQEAMAAAVAAWRRDGTPESAEAWMCRTAYRKALDIKRKQQAQRRTVARYADELLVTGRTVAEPPERTLGLDPEQLADSRLRLMLMCCHPALAPASQCALMLREVCGLSTDAVARLLLSDRAAVAQRLVRAKRKIRASRIPLRLPEAEELSSRMAALFRAVYLLFTKGFDVERGTEASHESLCAEAIYLADLVRGLLSALPAHGSQELTAEALGLSALLRFHYARRSSRTTELGETVLLEEQDRSLWHRHEIAEAQRILWDAISLRSPGSYQYQAAIASLHCDAASYEETDWRQIRLLYDRLLELDPLPAARAGRAIALALEQGPQAGLAELERLEADPALSSYHYYHVAVAKLCEKLGRTGEARRRLAHAQDHAESERDLRLIRRYLGELSDRAG